MRRGILLLAVAGVMLALGGTALAAEAPAVVITGTDGDDELEGTSAYDAIFAAAGDDRLDGRAGGDDLFGEAGSDTFVDKAGDDLLRGGNGDDILLDDAGSDLFSGGAGDDRISIPGFGPGPPELMWEPDEIHCGPGVDRVLAHAGDFVADDCEVVRRVGS